MARRARQRRLTVGHATRSQKQNFLNQFSPSPLQMLILIIIVV
ncbi:MULTISPECIES: hypothetical protein [unclassified Moorena]|nr:MULTISPECIES: hypothetical protein [unclassified Moorena]